MADGSIKIKTKLDNTDAQKDLNDLEKMCEKTAKNVEKTKTKVTVSTEPEDGVSTKKKSKWLSVGNDSSLKKAQARLQAIREEIKKIEAETDKDLQFAVTDDQTAKLLELEKGLTKDLNAEYEHLIHQVNKYQQAKQEAVNEKIGERQAKETFKGASAELSTEASSTAFLSKIQTQEQYNAALATTKARMTEIETSARRIATEKGVDVNSLLNANNEYQKLDSRLKILTAHHDDFKNKTTSAFTNASQMADTFGKSIKRGIKSMARYTLAIFGARGAFTAVRQVVNSYLQDNEALQNSIAGIKGAFGELLGPAIEKVINLFKIAMSYVFAFIKALTGVDYVARWNAKALEKQNKATKDLAKSQRQTAAFDEQNKLSDTSSSSSGASGGASGILDLPTLSDETLEKIQKYADKLKEAWKWVKDNKEELIAMAGAVAIAFAIGSIVNWVNAVGGIGAALGKVEGWLAKILPWITTIAGALLIGGGVFLIVDAIKDINENGVTCESILKLIAGAVMILVGAILLFNASLLKSPVTWIVLALAGLAAIFVTLYDKCDKFRQGMQKAWDGAKKVVQGFVDFFKGLFTGDKDLMSEGIKRMKEGGKQLVEGLGEGLSGAWEWLKTKAKEVWQKLVNGFKEFFGIHSPSTLFADFGRFMIDGLYNGLINAISKVRDAATKIWEAIKGCFSKVSDWFKDTFSKAWQKVKDVFSTGSKIFSGIKEGIESTFKTIVNKIIDGINKIISKPFNAINAMLNKIRDISVAGFTPFKSLWSYNPLSVPKIPKLAKGGIVHNIGKGVPLIAGEAGREAILPLDNNTEWMDILVDKINGGNTTIPIYLDGRMIAKYIIDLQKRQAFATNGG